MPFWTFQFSYQLWGMCSTNSSGIFGLDGIPGWGKKEVFPELCTSHCNVEEKWPTVQIFDLAQTMSKDVLHYSYFTSSLRIAITDKRCNNTGRSKIRISFFILTGTYWYLNTETTFVKCRTTRRSAPFGRLSARKKSVKKNREIFFPRNQIFLAYTNHLWVYITHTKFHQDRPTPDFRREIWKTLNS